MAEQKKETLEPQAGEVAIVHPLTVTERVIIPVGSYDASTHVLWEQEQLAAADAALATAHAQLESARQAQAAASASLAAAERRANEAKASVQAVPAPTEEVKTTRMAAVDLQAQVDKASAEAAQKNKAAAEKAAPPAPVAPAPASARRGKSMAA